MADSNTGQGATGAAAATDKDAQHINIKVKA